MKVKGFSLVELLVVMSIISILATVGLVSFQAVGAKARDSQRKSDLRNLSQALEIYYQKNSQYIGGIGDCNDTTAFYGSITIYMRDSTAPKDPLSQTNYCYQSVGNGTSFRLYAKLENCSDSEIIGACSDNYNFSVTSPDLIAAVFSVPSPSASPSPTSLPSPVAHWKFDENSGTIANDSSGFSNNSKAFIGNTTWTTGKFGSALTFDGIDDTVQIAESSSIDLGAQTDSYTVSAWIKTTATPSDFQTIVGKDDGSGVYPIRLYIDNPSALITFRISDGIKNPFTGDTATINDGSWHHVVGIRDVASDLLRMYVDGVQVDISTDLTTATTVNNDDISIGNSGTSYTGDDFNGQIDDVRIYNRALSAAEITAIYEGAP